MQGFPMDMRDISKCGYVQCGQGDIVGRILPTVWRVFYSGYLSSLSVFEPLVPWISGGAGGFSQLMQGKAAVAYRTWKENRRAEPPPMYEE